MNKQYLKNLECRKNEHNKSCDNCNRKPQVIYNPNGFVIREDGELWEICRTCLDKLFTLSKTKEKNESK